MPDNVPDDPETRWWAEDAERYNHMGMIFRKLGYTTPDGDAPPALNLDGSLTGTPEPEE